MKSMIWISRALLLCMLPIGASGQFSDNFEAPNLAAHWQGDTSVFRVWESALQLYDTMPGSSNTRRIFANVPTSYPDTCNWEARMELNFAPSASNYAILWLSASSADFSGPVSGYFLRMGGISGDLDALQLWRSDAGNNTLLLEGQAGAVALQPAIANVKVLRLQEGTWQLWVDYDDSNNFQLEGSVLDSTYTAGRYLVWECRYTSTRSQHFFLSDLWVAPLYEDTVPPKLRELEVVNSTELRLLFDEALDPVIAEDPARYSLSRGIGEAMEALPGEGADSSSVWLFFDSPMEHLETYVLTIDTLSDLRGNRSSPEQYPFTFFDVRPAQPFDVLITEIMADPSPPLGLPDAEYIELHYPGPYAIELDSWELEVGSQRRTLSNRLLLPGDYLILCREVDAALFEPYGDVLSLPSMPALSNAGTSIALYASNGNLIHQVPYTDAWYQHAQKKEGGWSLEMIDPEQACLGAVNWSASTHPLGGTPGKENSIRGYLENPALPKLLHIFPLRTDSLRVSFSGQVQRNPDPALFSIAGGPTISQVWPELPAGNALTMLLEAPIPLDAMLELRIEAGLQDCLGRPLAAQSALFGWPAPIEAGSIELNEIMYHPGSGAPQYLELRHRGEVPYALNELLVGNGTLARALTLQRLMLPGDYLVLCPAPELLQLQFPEAQPEYVIAQTLPNWKSPEGQVMLYTSEMVIDSMHYHDSLHNSLLSQTRGVAMERLEGSSHWHSAAALPGYGTPTWPNSQQWNPAETEVKRFFWLTPETFSPDGDGIDDLLQVNYAFDEPDYWADVYIYDASGRLVRKLKENTPLSLQGSLLWDGAGEQQEHLPVGVYLVWMRWWHPSGRSGNEHSPCVLARRR